MSPSDALVDHSLKVILDQQDDSGAFAASPDFETYRYCWLRDGAFIAHALDRYGHHAEAARFHQWVATTIERYSFKVEALAAQIESGEVSAAKPPSNEVSLHTRFTLDGEESDEEWGNFQLDGYGFWLTSLADHLQRTGADPTPYKKSVQVAARYLTLTWDYPCYDCWEEYPTAVHSTTVGAVGKGLASAATLLNDPEIRATADRAIEYVATNGVTAGSVRKFAAAPLEASAKVPGPVSPVAGHERIGRALADGLHDASSLLILGPFGPFAAGDPTIAATIAAVEDELVVANGVHRYADDEYYGGGQWVLLSAALAQRQAELDNADRSAELLAWVVQQADEHGNLPEQTSAVLLDEDLFAQWVERWGPIGSPLLWSHAMYLLAAVDYKLMHSRTDSGNGGC